MKSFERLVCCGLVFVLGTSHVEAGQAPKAQQSCQNFVQAFYDWYLHVAAKQTDVSPLDYAVKYRNHAFTSELIDRLKEKAETWDVDPLVNSQDPGEREVVGGVTIKGATCRAEIYDIRDGKRGDKPQVVAKLVRHGHSWVFVDF